MLSNDLTIIIISFNSGRVILEALGDVLRARPCRIIVVDNASTDGSSELVAGSYPAVEIVQATVNIGYGSAANLGLRLCTTPYCLLLNPDVRLGLPALQTCYASMASFPEDVAVCAPALETSEQQGEEAIEVKYLIGAFLMFRMSALAETGLFDEHIFLFYEEKDLERRLINQGYRLMLLRDIYVEHTGKGSTPAREGVAFLRNWHVAWSSLFYFHKHGIMNNRRQAVALVRKYFFKMIFHFNTAKRLKYRARYLGGMAWLQGEPAFNKNGSGKMSELVEPVNRGR